MTDDKITLSRDEARTVAKLTHLFVTLKRNGIFGGHDADKVEQLDSAINQQLKGKR